MARTIITTNDPGTLVLNTNFVNSSLTNLNVENDALSSTRYFLVPQSLIDISKLNNVSYIEGRINFTMQRSKGSVSPYVYIITGNKSSQNELDYNTGLYTSSGTKNIGCYTPSADTNFLSKYADGSILFDLDGIKYYAFKMVLIAGSILSKYTGTVVANTYSLIVEHDDSTKIYNGLSGITSAYLGGTKLNGIYLGSQKLL